MSAEHAAESLRRISSARDCASCSTGLEGRAVYGSLKGERYTAMTTVATKPATGLGARER